MDESGQWWRGSLFGTYYNGLTHPLLSIGPLIGLRECAKRHIGNVGNVGGKGMLDSSREHMGAAQFKVIENPAYDVLSSAHVKGNELGALLATILPAENVPRHQRERINVAFNELNSFVRQAQRILWEQS